VTCSAAYDNKIAIRARRSYDSTWSLLAQQHMMERCRLVDCSWQAMKFNLTAVDNPAVAIQLMFRTAGKFGDNKIR
jgi:hypothetical protein